MKRVFVILMLTKTSVLVSFGCNQKTTTPDAEKDEEKTQEFLRGGV